MPREIKKEKKVPGRSSKKVIKDGTPKPTPQRFPGNRSRVNQQEP